MSPAEFSAWVDRLFGPLRLFARQYGGTGEDAAQEAFLKLWGLRVPPDDVPAWLFTAARNAALDAARSETARNRRDRSTARRECWFVEEATVPDEAAEALRHLSLESREVVAAHLWGGLTFAQVGELLGVSASAAHRRYQAALAELRKVLDPEVSNAPR